MNYKVELNIYKEIEFTKESIRITQKESEYLVIDYSLILDKDYFIKELKNLRINSSNLKIIIIARNYKPGSNFLKSIVNLGIYNIITENNFKDIIKEFLSILENNKTYSDVAKFDCKIIEKKEKIKEKSVIVHHLGSKIISCIGSQSGLGITHTLITLANHLSSNNKVAYIEMNNSFEIESFGKSINRIENDEKKFKYKKVDYYWQVNLSEFLNQNKNKYEYLIIDFGKISNIINYDYFLMSDIKLCMISGIDWKIKSSKEAYDYLSEIDVNNNWIYLVPFIEKKYIRELNKYIKNDIFSIPFNLNPFKPEKDIIETFDKILYIDRDAGIIEKIWKGAKNGLW